MDATTCCHPLTSLANAASIEEFGTLASYFDLVIDAGEAVTTLAKDEPDVLGAGPTSERTLTLDQPVNRGKIGCPPELSSLVYW
jgi:hypothetical protein